MTTSVAIIGLGIMGSRMLNHMRLHEEFSPDFLWDPNPIACKNIGKQDSKSQIMKSANEAIENADLVYLACPPSVREMYAIKNVEMGKALFLEKPFGINIQESKNFIEKLKNYDVPIIILSNSPIKVPIEVELVPHMSLLYTRHTVILNYNKSKDIPLYYFIKIQVSWTKNFITF